MRPVYESKTVVLSNIRSDEPKSLNAPGKIFIQGDYIFVNEVNKGIHIINNKDLRNPKIMAFINIPGNLDIAVKGNMLYADMFTDLVVIDISDPLNTKLIRNISSVFPERNYGSTIINDSSMLIVDWISKDTVVNAELNPNPWVNCPNCVFMSADFSASKAGTVVPGIAGSMARFSIVNNYLYTVNSAFLKVFDIRVPSNPVSKNDFYVGQNIETIYPFKEKLFIGSSSGMFIYNINQPEAPSPEGSFSHARACDPVVADDQYAFVTLRTGNACMGTNNQLDVIDISDVLHPTLLKTYLMSNPHGLARDGNLLFVCDGNDGLKIYDASDVMDLKMIEQFKHTDTYDVIAWNGKLLLVSSDGLHQYAYDDRNNVSFISKLRISARN